jgi:hypothetical protein
MSTRQETRRPYDPTPEQKARADLSVHPDLRVLSDASPEALVDVIIRLTHRIHDAKARYVSLPDGCTPGEVAGLRRQRDLCRAELIRRAGA